MFALNASAPPKMNVGVCRQRPVSRAEERTLANPGRNRASSASRDNRGGVVSTPNPGCRRNKRACQVSRHRRECRGNLAGSQVGVVSTLNRECRDRCNSQACRFRLAGNLGGVDSMRNLACRDSRKHRECRVKSALSQVVGRHMGNRASRCSRGRRCRVRRRNSLAWSRPVDAGRVSQVLRAGRCPGKVVGRSLARLDSPRRAVRPCRATVRSRLCRRQVSPV